MLREKREKKTQGGLFMKDLQRDSICVSVRFLCARLMSASMHERMQICACVGVKFTSSVNIHLIAWSSLDDACTA